AVTLVGGAGRSYDADDLGTVEELARRSALAIANARLYREAQAAVRTRDESLATIAHDLRNPLSAIRGRAELMQVRARRSGSQELGSFLLGLQQIEAITGQVAQMIDQLLDLVRLEAGQALELTRGPTELVALARRVAAAH